MNEYNTFTNELESFEGFDNKPKLEDESFKKLKIIKFDNKYNNLCPICFDNIIYDENIIRLNCNHNYHIDCIKEWLCKNSNTCPLCKESVNV